MPRATPVQPIVRSGSVCTPAPNRTASSLVRSCASVEKTSPVAPVRCHVAMRSSNSGMVSIADRVNPSGAPAANRFQVVSMPSNIDRSRPAATDPFTRVASRYRYAVTGANGPMLPNPCDLC